MDVEEDADREVAVRRGFRLRRPRGRRLSSEDVVVVPVDSVPLDRPPPDSKG